MPFYVQVFVFPGEGLIPSGEKAFRIGPKEYFDPILLNFKSPCPDQIMIRTILPTGNAVFIFLGMKEMLKGEWNIGTNDEDTGEAITILPDTTVRHYW